MFLFLSRHTPQKKMPMNPCDDVTPREQWEAYVRLLRKVGWGYFRKKSLLITDIVLILLWILAVYTTNYRPPIPGPIETIELIAIGIFAITFLLLILYVPVSDLLAALLVDQIGWSDIERCFRYLDSDIDMSDECKLDAIRHFAESSIGPIWGAITVLGIIFGFAGSVIFADTTKAVDFPTQTVLSLRTAILIIGLIAGFLALTQVIIANSNSVILRAVTLWQKNPEQARRTARAVPRQRK